MVKIHASTLPIKQKKLKQTIKKLEPHINAFHIDIMDGKLTKKTTPKNITQKISKLTNKKLSIHLMTKKPETHIKKLPKQTKEICFHYEATKKITQTINQIQKQNKKAGIAINPNTPTNKINKYLKKTDYIILMSVQPGKTGQKYIPNTEKKLQQLKKTIKKHKTKTKIYIDGGINPTNAKKLIKNGANTLITGNYLNKQKNIKKAIKELTKKTN